VTPAGFAAAGRPFAELGVAFGASALGGTPGPSRLPGLPGGDPLPAPASPSGATGSSTASGASGAPAFAALADGPVLPAGVLLGALGGLADDRIPGSPIADHDISPD
jgi:hypothetical protein